ncbi:nuclear transport factor 2 family protein [Microbispora sp. NPDC049125]|uniref:nuclear transport factor 2 family protein n=1 Tax=Microbispora sp. NPDC049125 TaxID=3154929 RepID=UPI0034665BBD
MTVGAIAARLGAPSGSIYHRYTSRDLLMAHLWIRTVRRFQEGFLRAAGAPDPAEAAAGAVAYVVRWAAERPGEARLLLLHRREDLLARWPEALSEDLARLNRPVDEALARLADRLLLVGSAEERRERVTFAAQDPGELLAVLHPEFVGRVSPGMPLDVGRVHHGPQAMLRDCWAVIFKELDTFPAAEEFVWSGPDRVIALGRYRGTARRTGRPHDAVFAHDLRLRDGLVVELTQVTDTARWHDALAPCQGAVPADEKGRLAPGPPPSRLPAPGLECFTGS